LRAYVVEHGIHLIGSCDVEGAVPGPQRLGRAIGAAAGGDKLHLRILAKCGDELLAQQAVGAGDEDAHGAKMRKAGRSWRHSSHTVLRRRKGCLMRSLCWRMNAMMR